VAGAALALALAGGCGVDTDDGPRALSPEDDSGAVISDPPAPPAEELLDAPPGTQINVYFTQAIDNELRLVPRQRTVPDPPTEAEALDALLLDPPAGSERDDGVVTAIPASTAMVAPPVREDGGTLLVLLNEGLFTIEGESLRLAYGQLVCTATSLGTVSQVYFRVAGRPAAAVDGAGREVNEPVSCDDYEELLAPEDATPSTTSASAAAPARPATPTTAAPEG
jgi:hypothetical protein